MSRSAPRRPLTMDRSLTTWHHNMTGPGPAVGKIFVNHSKSTRPIPLPSRKGGLMAHKALKAHTFPRAEIQYEDT